MSIRIAGIDASLSSTGVCVAECSITPEYTDYLGSLLVDKSDYKLGFNKLFNPIICDDVKEDKALKKEIAKVRKSIREFPTFELLRLEEILQSKRVNVQVEGIIDILPTNIDFLFIEDYSYHSAGRLTQLAEMKGVLRRSLIANKYDYMTANINAVKKVASMKGNGNKDDIAEHLPRFGFGFSAKEDDKNDAIGVCLAVYYAIIHKLYGIILPEYDGEDKKERTKWKNKMKTFMTTLDTFGERIGSVEELDGLES